MHRKKVFLVLLMAGMAMVLATGSAFGGEKNTQNVTVELLPKVSSVYGCITDYIRKDEFEIIYATGEWVCHGTVPLKIAAADIKLLSAGMKTCKEAATTLGYSHVYYAFDHYKYSAGCPDGRPGIYARANVICLVKKNC